MASDYKIHKPYILATLPRPLEHTGGGIVARETYGQRDGIRKKRAELAVGVDGEAASIYDVPGSKLVTSYPIPPHESFTCPPHSLKIRHSESTDITRYTFIGTKNGSSYRVTLFKDVVRHDGKTTSTTEHRALRDSPVHYITTSGASTTSSTGDVIAVCENGDVFCLSEDSLALRWMSPAKTALQDAFSAVDNFQVEFTTSATMTELSEGIFKDRPEVWTALPKHETQDPTLLVLVSRSSSKGKQSRHLLVLGVASRDNPAASALQRLTPLDVAPIRSPEDAAAGEPQYHFEAKNGVLLQLLGGSLTVYDLHGAVPKLRSVIAVDGAVTFAGLFRSFVLSCSEDSIALYNHQYCSVHGRTRLDLSDFGEDQMVQSIRMVGYLRSQNVVVALIDNNLACIHVEPPRMNGKNRKPGMLIDSIGRGTAVEIPAEQLKYEKPAFQFSQTLPQTMTVPYLAEFQKDVEKADEFLRTDNFIKWEELLRERFHMKRLPHKGDAVEAGGQPISWDWYAEPSAYAQVDRRWIIYAISRLFTIEKIEDGDASHKLQLELSDCPILAYLAVVGHLTLSNLQSAFREELEATTLDAKHLAQYLIRSLTEEDPSMTLLLNYVRGTKLGEVEVLLAIKALMLAISSKAQSDVMELDEPQPETAVSRNSFSDESSSLGAGLNLAFTKLWHLPSRTTVKAMKSTLKPEEILSLIHVLRVKLVQGGWTSLYTDITAPEAEETETSSAGGVSFISELLSRCLDAVGAGGWLFNDGLGETNGAESNDFISALKLEVTAALEGVREAVSLNSVVSEYVNFAVKDQKSRVHSGTIESRETRMLPLSLKPKLLITKNEIKSGGEVVKRSTRMRGHLISQKVEPYSITTLP